MSVLLALIVSLTTLLVSRATSQSESTDGSAYYQYIERNSNSSGMFSTWIEIPIAPINTPGSGSDDIDSSWMPPRDCQVFRYETSTETIQSFSGATASVTEAWTVSYYSHHCGPFADGECCPPRWNSEGYYTGYVPLGYEVVPPEVDVEYSPMRRVGDSTQTGNFACPRVPVTPILCQLTPCIPSTLPGTVLMTPRYHESSASWVWQLENGYKGQHMCFWSNIINTTGFTALWASANAILVFDPVTSITTNSDQGTGDSGGQSGGRTTKGGLPEETGADPREGSRKGLSTGEIIGIAFGVAIPVLGGIGFVFWRFSKKKKKNTSDEFELAETKSSDNRPAISRFGVRPPVAPDSPTHVANGGT